MSRGYRMARTLIRLHLLVNEWLWFSAPGSVTQHERAYRALLGLWGIVGALLFKGVRGER